MLDFAVLAAGALLSVLALPNEVFPGGWGWLGPVALAPAFWFLLRRPPGVAALGGVFWAVAVTFLSQSWLLSFHPLAFPLVLLFQVPWYAGVFTLVSFLVRRRGSWGPWGPAFLWTGFEFLRIQGFFAFPYGSLASSFWAYPITFQSADLVGVWGLTFLLAWTSAWLAFFLSRKLSWGRLQRDLGVGLGLWGLNLGYGAFQLLRPDTGDLWRPALVQHAQDPWSGGPAAYEAGFEKLEALSQRALVSRPDAVVWSETAFIPSVAFHTKYRENPESLRLVRRLEAFLGSAGVPFLVGNDHREKASDGTLRDYNAVLAWNASWTGRYEKNRLVPFTESFPFQTELPGVYQMLLEADTHFWEPGRGQPLLLVGGIPVGTPVCYEDAFPEGGRAFALAGARALVNLTNDAWAPGTASRMQHLSLAVFRAVEYRLPLLRAGNDGATAALSSRGERLGQLPVGSPGVLLAEVRLGSGSPTVYARTGDAFAWASAGLSALLLVWPARRRSDVDKGPQL